MLPDLQLNDLVRLRKPHPCGSYEWTVVRLGADIGLECKGCGHRILLTRRELSKRMKANLTRKAGPAVSHRRAAAARGTNDEQRQRDE